DGKHQELKGTDQFCFSVLHGNSSFSIRLIVTERLRKEKGLLLGTMKEFALTRNNAYEIIFEN
ncbi:MAG: hypothetical protein IJT05_02700, partial [Lachnospiraceae bacterium]|nr:hypothetical protein [Lachnospiraceae bacterium]